MKTSAEPNALEIRKILVAVGSGGISDGAICRGRELQAAFDAELEAVHVVAPGHVGAAFRPGRAGTGGTGVFSIQGDPGHALVERVRAKDIDLLVLGGMRERKHLDFGSTARTVYATAPCSLWMQPADPRRIRSIAVGLDDSAESPLALANAIDLAQRFQARLRAVHVFDPRAYSREEWFGFPSFAASPDVGQAACERFERQIENVDWRGVDHSWEFRVGNLVDKLREQLATVDLLVMGSRQRSKLVSTALGSVAYHLLAHAQNSVWVVRARSDRSGRATREAESHTRGGPHATS